ncbi:hypothetical protein F2Q68_00030727 [Brassica cretica]|uniref:Protein dehydration-induced 19 C-terminal domain-containing protein n=2 Tax=Brassica cretica TaxID=69181 RepID=A0ABQ7BI08_BRACR|nr:hypothetical protein F2Q68_00030727 [Brassica cretica]KAF3531545.1 hypothetical protein DY000_02039283 [Brassica cretica]
MEIDDVEAQDSFSAKAQNLTFQLLLAIKASSIEEKSLSNGSVERNVAFPRSSRRQADELTEDSERRAQAQGSPPVRSSQTKSSSPLSWLNLATSSF